MLLDGLKMVNNHFADDSLLSMHVEQSLVDGAHACLVLFCLALSAMVSDHKIDLWLVGLDSPLGWILTA